MFYRGKITNAPSVPICFARCTCFLPSTLKENFTGEIENHLRDKIIIRAPFAADFYPKMCVCGGLGEKNDFSIEFFRTIN